MIKPAYETWSRTKSHIMFGLCVSFTVAILTVLGLVTGFLTANGYKGITARPGQIEGTFVRATASDIVIAPLATAGRGEHEMTFHAPPGITIIDAQRETLQPGMTLVIRYSTADPDTATYVKAFVQGRITAIDAQASSVAVQRQDGKISRFTIPDSAKVIVNEKPGKLAGMAVGDQVQLRFLGSDGTIVSAVESPAPVLPQPQAGLVPPILSQDPQLSQLEPDYPGGLKNGIMGTLVLIGLASLVGIPVGMLTGVFLAEYSSASVLATPVRFIADVLTGVPSIVVGILGYELLVKPFRELQLGWGPTGFNGWAGSLALAFIMVPLVARTTEEMLLLVPRSYREASVALGATKARTIIKVVLPAAMGSVITGIMLAIARVAGETAPLLFTVYGLDSMEWNPNHQFPALTLQIYKNSMTADDQRNSLAWAGILILLLLIFVLNVIVRSTARAMSRGKTAAA